MQELMLPMLYWDTYRECQWLHASAHFSPSIRMPHTCVDHQHASIFIPKRWRFHKMRMFFFFTICHFCLLNAFFLHISTSLSRAGDKVLNDMIYFSKG